MPHHLLSPLRRFWFFFAVALSFSMFGCSLPPHIRLKRESEPLSSAACTALTQNALQLSNSLLTLKFLARTTVEASEQREQFRYALVFRAPHNIRVELFPEGQAFSMALFVQTPDGALLLIPSEKEALLAPSDSGLLREIVSIPVVESDLPYLVSGLIPPRLTLNSERARCRAGLNEWNLSVANYVFVGANGKSNFTHAYVLDEFSDTLRAEIALDFDVDSHPKSATVSLNSPDAVLRLAYQQFNPHSPPSDAAFEVNAPSGYLKKFR